MTLKRMWQHPVSAFGLMVGGIWLLWTFKQLVIFLLAAMLVALLLLPVVNWLARKGLPRYIGGPAVLAVLAGLVVLSFSMVLPPLINQAAGLVSVLNNDVAHLDDLVGRQLAQQALDTASQAVQHAGETVLNVTTQALKTLGLALVAIFFGLYWVIDYPSIKRYLLNLVSPKYQNGASQLAGRVEVSVIEWLRGQVILSLAVGVLSGIAYAVIGLPFVFILALIAALLEIVPFIGPFLAAIPAISLGVTISPTKGLLAFLAYVVIQNVEAHILAPNVMSRAVNLHPLVVILSFLVGEKLAGFAGVLLAVPFALVVREIIEFAIKPRGTKV